MHINSSNASQPYYFDSAPIKESKVTPDLASEGETPIFSVSDLMERLRSKLEVELNTTNVAAFKKAVYELFDVQANVMIREAQEQNPGVKKEVAPHAAASCLLQTQCFDYDTLCSIRRLREFCERNGDMAINAAVRHSDFSGISHIAAFSVAMQTMIITEESRCELNMAGLAKILNSNDYPKPALFTRLIKLQQDIDDWLEGRGSNQLPEVLSLTYNKEQAERIFSLKY